MALTSEIRVSLTGTQTATNDLGTPRFTPDIEKVFQLASGVAANQADIFWGDTRTLLASATENLDLAGVLFDAFGATIAAVELVAIIVLADAANVNDVVVGAAASPVPFLGGTTPTLSVKPGGLFLLVAPNANGQCLVTATTADLIKVANSAAGTSVKYTIAVIARSA